MHMSEEAYVVTCLADECSYNCLEGCCAPPVEVGAEHPACDTFTTGDAPVGDSEPRVRDCKVMDCYFNRAEACTAIGITVIAHLDHADCATFRQ